MKNALELTAHGIRQILGHIFGKQIEPYKIYDNGIMYDINGRFVLICKDCIDGQVSVQFTEYLADDDLVELVNKYTQKTRDQRIAELKKELATLEAGA